jgi:2-polyprenyl-3-methyl-5-hydroxy-6-metoxy-1,4-benzoquinol methylase
VPSSDAALTRECCACGSGDVAAWRLASASDSQLSARLRYSLERCGSCGTARIATAERLEESRLLYASGVYSVRQARLDAVIEPLRRLGDRDRMRVLRGLTHGTRVFEVGAGDGRLLSALSRAGYEVGGSEPAIDYARACRARGFDVAELPVEELDLEADSRDVVILWHVLEHLAEPLGALRRIHRWLATGGELVVAVPNLSSLQAAIGRDLWFQQDVPRHRTMFTTRGLVALLERVGFRPTRTTTRLIDQSVLGMWQTLLNLVTGERDVLFRALKRQATGSLDLAVTAVAAPVLAPVAVGLELVAGLLGRGGSIVVRATAP